VKQFNPEIIILDNFARGRRENLRWALAHGRVEVLEGDVRDSALVHEVMSGVDVLFHHASIPRNECSEDPRLALDVLATGTFNVLEAAALNRVRKVVAASSASIYGLADEFPTKEHHHPYNIRTFHGSVKAFTEALLRSFYDMYGVNYVALRYFNIYGPRMDSGSYAEVIPRWIQRLSNHQPCTIIGDGSHTFDFVYVEDIARANILAAVADVTDEVFNIASGVGVSLNELATTLGRVMGSNTLPDYTTRGRTAVISRCVGDTTKAEQMLGFRVSVPLEEGLWRLVTWWERQRELEAAIA
jgi:UDP-glucose 4-epimerase